MSDNVIEDLLKFRINHPWCSFCGTTHRDPLVTAECQRMREAGETGEDA